MCERVRELDSRLNPEEFFQAVLHRWSVQQRKTGVGAEQRKTGVAQNGPISTEKTERRKTARSAQIRLSVQGLCAKKLAQSSFNFFWLRELHHFTPQGRGAGSAFEVGRELRAKFTDAGPLP